MQTLDEFLHQERERVRKFGVWWMMQRSLMPDDFPTRMDESSWDEALMTFVEDD